MDMRLFSLVIFLTLVGSNLPVRAAPSVEPHRLGLPKDVDQSLKDPSASESLALAKTSDLDLQFHVGLLNGNLVEKNNYEQPTFVGSLVSWRDQADRAVDFEVDLTSDSLIRLSVALRKDLEWHSSYSPYWKWGSSQILDGSSLAASVVELRRLKAFAAIGWADLFEQNREWNSELQAGWGLVGPSVEVKFGWNVSL